MKLPSKLTRKRENGDAPARGPRRAPQPPPRMSSSVDLTGAATNWSRASPSCSGTSAGSPTKWRSATSIRVEVLVKRAVVLQDADAELSEVERIVRMEETGTAGSCTSCGAPHSNGATFCWQCGQPLLEQVSGDAILRG